MGREGVSRRRTGLWGWAASSVGRLLLLLLLLRHLSHCWLSQEEPAGVRGVHIGCLLGHPALHLSWGQPGCSGRLWRSLVLVHERKKYPEEGPSATRVKVQLDCGWGL